MLESSTKERKVTVLVPGDLRRKAQRSSGEGVTATIRRGLQLVAASRTHDRLRGLRGKVRVQIDLDALREGRE